MHTFENMLTYVTDPSESLTAEANEELAMARRQVLEALNHQREAFVDQHSQLPGAGELYDLTSVMNWKMPPRNDWSYYTYYVSYGTLFGMIISQLNWCLETSGRVAARLAAIDYVRHYAASYGIRFD